MSFSQLYQGSKETLLESLQRIRQAAVQIIGAITRKESAEADGAEWQGAGEVQVTRAA